MLIFFWQITDTNNAANLGTRWACYILLDGIKENRYQL